MKKILSVTRFLVGLGFVWFIFAGNNPAYSQVKSFNGSSVSAPEIYIPANKRHQGLSRFDQLPFTDRQKGDPDRYRAVNPKYVRKENGHYYFVLTAKVNTHYFDENLNDKGTLPLTSVEIDLAQSKTGKTSDGKTEKYVYVKDMGYISSRNLTQTVEDIRSGNWFKFPIKSGEYDIYDGAGMVRGKLAAESVKLNYGQQKNINGEPCYYAFATRMKALDGSTAGASGWIKASAIKEGNDPNYPAEVVEKMQPAPTVNDNFTQYEITGGEREEALGKDENGKATYKFGYMDEKGEFIAYKVLPKIALDGNQSDASTDYLKRNDDVINLGFNVAGVSNDTFRVKGANRPLTFYRSSDKEATAVIDLFYPKDDAHDGETPVGKMYFVYGYVDTPGGKRWGWIALGALKPKA